MKEEELKDVSPASRMYRDYSVGQIALPGKITRALECHFCLNTRKQTLPYWFTFRVLAKSGMHQLHSLFSIRP